MFLLSWLVFPALAALVCLGCGLLVRVVAGRLTGVLLLPVGLAFVIVFTSLATELEATARLSGPALILVAAIGLILGRAELLRGLKGASPVLWSTAAGAVAFLSYGAPVLLSGRASISGYTRIVDIGHFLDLTARISAEGRHPPERVISSFDEVVAKTLAVHYPGGTFAPLGSLAEVMGTDPLWVYQPYLALLGAITAISAFALLGKAIERPWLRAAAAGVSAQPTILYSYALAGGIKELATVAMLVLTTAVLAEHRPGSLSVRGLVPAALAMAAVVTTFTIAAAPWLGLLVLIVFAFDLVLGSERSRVVGKWAALGLMTFVLALPTLRWAIPTAPSAAPNAPSFDLGLGNLAEPISALASLGVWITPDHRFPIEDPALTHIFLVAVVLMAVAGLLWAIRRRQVALVGLLLAGGVALPYVISRTGPWLELKAFTITSAIVVVLAFVGAGVLTRGRHAVFGVLAVGIVAAGVLLGNANIYHGVTLGPHDRFRDLERIGKDYAGQGPALYPAFDEYAEYLLRREDTTGLVNPPRGRVLLRPGLDRRPGRSYSLGDFQYSYLQSFRLLVLRRSPAADRPPSNWRLVRRTKFHTVWRRGGDPRSIVAHIPLGSSPDRQGCAGFLRTVERAGPRARVAYVRRSVPLRVDLVGGSHAAGWATDQSRDQLVTKGPGSVRTRFRTTTAGSFRLFLGGSIGRQLTVSIDGRPVVKLANRANYPGQFEDLGSVSLAPGTHVVEISRGGGDLRPGTGDEPEGRRLGPMMVVSARPAGERVQTVPATDARRICRNAHLFEWVELLRPL